MQLESLFKALPFFSREAPLARDENDLQSEYKASTEMFEENSQQSNECSDNKEEAPREYPKLNGLLRE